MSLKNRHKNNYIGVVEVFQIKALLKKIFNTFDVIQTLDGFNNLIIQSIGTFHIKINLKFAALI